MKICPKCNLPLPEKIHFCPKCMYEYPKEKFIVEKSRQIKKEKLVVTAFVFILVSLALLFLGKTVLDLVKRNDAQMKAEKQKQVEQIFQTSEDIFYNPNIVYDFREGLADYNLITQMLGEETESAYIDGDYTIHKFGVIEIYVAADQNVKSVSIEYANADEIVKVQYGILGINGKSTREDALKILGKPEQQYGKEWDYFFDGIIGTPTLRIVFDENNTVAELQYYTLQ